MTKPAYRHAQTGVGFAVWGRDHRAEIMWFWAMGKTAICADHHWAEVCECVPKLFDASFDKRELLWMADLAMGEEVLGS